MKLPAFQFYPADWRKDPAVQSLSFHDRGVWFEMLCLMHESEQRGKLLLNGKKMPDEALSRLLGLDKQSLTKTIHRLLECGAASVCGETGAIINRRMVRDEEIRNIRKSCGKMGGNPNLVNQNSNQIPTTRVNQNPTPSSSSSSSTSVKEGAAVAAPPSEVDLKFPANIKTARVLAVWEKWVKVRKAYRKPKDGWYEYFKDQLEKLSTLPEPQVYATLEEAWRNRYQGLFPDKHARAGMVMAQPKSNPLSF